VNGLVNGNTAADCEFAGVDPADFGSIPPNPAAQYNGRQGGNRDLTPEEADTFSVGFVFQPPFVRNLVLAVDYFDIDISNVILGGGLADAFLISCVTSHNPETCSKIHRDAQGSLWRTPEGFVDDVNANVSALTSVGIDTQATYSFDIGSMGRLGFNLVGTWVSEAMTQLVPDTEAFDCVGLYGANCGVPTPEWRHSFRTTWNTPWHGIDVGVNWRYFDPVKLEKTDDNLFITGPVPATDAYHGSRSYIDATAAVTFADRYTIRLGANNLFDRDPPLVGQANCPAGPCNGNTWAQLYDVLGRQIFATLTMDF
jgi:outer membrane receptor protein involved in Fe transport